MSLGKIARDVDLLAQAEVAEAVEARARDVIDAAAEAKPVRAVLIVAAARARARAGRDRVGAMVQEHERAAGAWHAEWETVRDLLRVAGGASHHAAVLLGLAARRPQRMGENLASDGGLVMAESLALQLSRHTIGRSAARDMVRRCSDEAVERHVPFAEVVRGDPEVRRHLSEDDRCTAHSIRGLPRFDRGD